MLTARIAEGDVAPGYERHRPEHTLLYQIIKQHYPDFLSEMEAQDRPLPSYVQDEFEAFLECGRLENGFLRVRCEDCKHEHLVAFSCKKRGIYSGLPALRPSGLPSAVQIAPSNLVPELRCPAHGRKRSPPGG